MVFIRCFFCLGHKCDAPSLVACPNRLHRTGITLGERVLRTLQWNAAPRGSQCRVVHHNKAGSDRHQPVAQTVQPHPPAPGPEYATDSPRNSIQEWHRTWGLDTSTLQSRRMYNCRTPRRSSVSYPHVPFAVL